MHSSSCMAQTRWLIRRPLCRSCWSTSANRSYLLGHRWEHLLGHRWEYLLGHRWEHLLGHRWEHLRHILQTLAWALSSLGAVSVYFMCLCLGTSSISLSGYCICICLGTVFLSGHCIWFYLSTVSVSGYYICFFWVLHMYVSGYQSVSGWELYTNTISGYCICFNLGTVSVYCSYLFLGTVSVYCICLFLGTLSGSVSLLYPLLMGYCVCLLYLGTVSGMVLSSSGSMLYLLTIPGGTISIGFCAWKSQLGDTLRGIYMLFTYAYTCILHWLEHLMTTCIGVPVTFNTLMSLLT